MKIITIILRGILALTFLFSGLVKANDPLGTVYKMQEYFTAWGIGNVSYYLVVSLTIILTVFEFCLGGALAIGNRKALKNGIKIATVFIAVMTVLTLWIAITDAVEDCGCFGDVIKLTNWETFFKNVLLLAICVTLWYKKDGEPCIKNDSIYKMLDPIICGFIVALSIISLNHLPRIDTSAYKIGTKLSKIDAFFVEKDGKDITKEITNRKGKTLLLVAPYLQDADDSHMNDYNGSYRVCLRKGYGFYCLTASDSAAISKWKHDTAAKYPFCFANDTELKAMIRSNPGLIVIENGIIVGKYSHNDFKK